MSKVRGKVAKILNSRELVLNIGSTNGVKIGMLFDILEIDDEKIIDPDTREVLGTLSRPKIRIKVIDVQEKISIASTYKGHQINIGGEGIGVFNPMSNLTKSLMPPRYITRFETLKTDEKTWEAISEKESFVKTGDPVVQVVEVPIEMPQMTTVQN